MELVNKPRFLQVLAETMLAYGKPLPEQSVLAAWWRKLEPYPLHIVEAALLAYGDEQGDFAPLPAGIAMRCKVMDGRLESDEAWATALLAASEANTVVWTDEMAEAFALCRPILDHGDKVGARMAFKDAYERLVAQARATRLPARWYASLGWDQVQRDAVLEKAARIGRLVGPAVAGLLVGPADPVDHVDAAPADTLGPRAKLDVLRRMLADAAREKELRRAERIAAEQLADTEWKRRTGEEVARHQRDRAA